MRFPVRARRCALAALGSATVWAVAAADNSAALQVTLGAGETDNVSLAETGARSQTVGTAGVDFRLKRDGARLSTDATGNFSYFDYLEGAYSNQLLGRFDGTATLGLVPKRIEWVFGENFGRAQVDPLLPLVPTNLENVNVVSTGPELHLLLGLTNFLQLSGRYALVHYETSPFDSKRGLGNIVLGHRLSEHANITLSGEYESLHFDETLASPNYDRRRMYLGYEIQGARTRLVANAGAAQYNESGHWRSSPIVELGLTRRVSPASTLTLSLGRQYTDAGDSFPNLRSGAAGGIVIGPVAGTAFNYLSNYGSGTWRLEYLRTAVAASARWERDTYAGAPLFDVTRGELALSIERRLSAMLTGQLLGSFDRTDYRNQKFATDDTQMGAAVTLHSARRVELKLRYKHLQRTASGAVTGYKDNQVFLTVTYAILRSESPVEPPAQQTPIS